MIVDMHTHLSEPEHYDGEFRQGMEASWSTVGFSEGTPAVHRPAMDGVDKAVVLAFDAPKSGFVVPNEYVAAYVATDPDRLIGFASVDANRPDAAEILRWTAEDLGMRGLKIGPIYQHVDPTGIAMDRLLGEAVKLGMPVLIHQGTTFVRDAPLEYARPWLLDRVATRHPDMKMYIAHLGHPWCDETMVVIRKHPGLFADVSALHTRPWQLYNALRSAIEYGVADKLLFGTDYPFGNAELLIAALYEVSAMAERVGLPPVPRDVIDGIIHRPSLELVGLA